MSEDRSMSDKLLKKLKECVAEKPTGIAARQPWCRARIPALRSVSEQF